MTFDPPNCPPAEAELEIYRKTAGQPDHYQLQYFNAVGASELTFTLNSLDLASPSELEHLANEQREIVGILKIDEEPNHGFRGRGKRDSYELAIVDGKTYPHVTIERVEWFDETEFAKKLKEMKQEQAKVRHGLTRDDEES